MASSSREPHNPLNPALEGESQVDAGEWTDRPGWPPGTGTLEDHLFADGSRFDFFQAVRLLQRIAGGNPVGRSATPAEDAVRFRAHLSLGFPASAIHEVRRFSHPVASAAPGTPRAPVLVQSFLGLHGPSGVLPIHYTERLLAIRRHATDGGPSALVEWFDLFNHRFTSLFYWAWEKYRPFPAYERGEYRGREPDAFTSVLFSVVGLGLPALRNRLGKEPDAPINAPAPPIAVDDFTLLRFGGLLAQRPSNPASLEQVLNAVLGTPVEVVPFRGEWLRIAEDQQTRLGWEAGRNHRLGVTATAGVVVWDIQGRFRVRVGPMDHARFVSLLTPAGPRSEEGPLGQLCRLIRLYAGPDLDFDVQLTVTGSTIPPCRLDADDPVGARLGWNTWLFNDLLAGDLDDPDFDDDFPERY